MEQKESKIVIGHEVYGVSHDGYEYKVNIDDAEGMVYVNTKGWPEKSDGIRVLIRCSFAEMVALRDVLSDVVRRIRMHEDQ